MNRRRVACICLAALCVPVGGGAQTEVSVRVGEGIRSVENPFQFPSGSTDPLKRDDTVRTTDVGVAIRTPMPSDRSFLSIGATASQQRYDALPQLDHTERQLDALYQWEYGTVLRGRVRHRYDERLYNYYGGFLTTLETPHATQDLAELSLRITPELELPVTVTRGSLSYSDAGLSQRYNQEDRGLQLALSYTSGRNSVFRAGVRQADVRYPNRSAADVAAIDSGFTEREAFVDVSWRYSQDTAVFGRIGKLDRTFNSLANRDTQLVSVSSGLEWRYSPKTFLFVRGYRQPQSNAQADVRLYVISTGLEARLQYDMTAKTRIGLTGGYEQQKYQGFSNTSAVATGGTDKVTRVGATVEYQPTLRVLLRGELAHQRNEVDPVASTLGQFSRNTLQLGLSYTFENMLGTNRAHTLLDTMRYDRIQ